MTTLTDKIVTAPVTKRTRIFDDACPGFYADITPTNASFRLKVWNAARGIQDNVLIGRFNPVTLTTALARREAFRLKGEGGDVAAKVKNAAAVTRAQGVTFNQVADEYQAHSNAHHARARDTAYFLKAPREAFGNKTIGEVTARDIVVLLKTFTDRGKLGMARKVRTTLHALFRFGAEAGREYVTANPCTILPKQSKATPKDRFLTDEEIRALWHGLDRPDLPAPRPVALALKLILVTALRPSEVLTARRSEIKPLSRQHGGDGGVCYAIPAERVKLRRRIVQPLNSLAQGLVDELVALDGQGGLLFPSGAHGAPLKNTDLSTILHGKWQVTTARKYRQPGLCDWLGIAKFTPHDLRRTAATQLGIHDVSILDSGRILDHDISEPGESNTTKIYDVSRLVQQTPRRRKTLDRLDAILREAIGEPPTVVRLRVA